MSVFDFEVTTIRGEVTTLAPYKGNVLLIVNTATKCGLTPQLHGLQALHEKYAEKGLTILGFPCSQFMNQELPNNADILEVCSVNYGVTFPMFAKIDVNGRTAHPLYKYLKKQQKGLLGSEAIKWNFTKFLVDREGNVLERFAPNETPEEIEAKIASLLH
jgi:glutathione peroxidase